MKISKNKIKKAISNSTIFLLVLIVVFSNFVSFFPQLLQNNKLLQNLEIKKASALTTTKTFSFTVDQENFVGTSGGKSVLTYDSGIGNPSGSLKTTSIGRNNTDISNWTWTGTWEELGAPSGSTITDMRIESGYTYVTVWNVANSVTIGPYKIKDSLDIDQATLWNGRTVTTGTDGNWVSIPQQTDQAIPSAIQASNSTIKLYLERLIDLGNDKTAEATIYEDELSFIITYDLAVSPPDATGFINDTEGTLLDGGRSSQQITITGSNFGSGPSDGNNNVVKIGTFTVPDVTVTTWNDTTIIFTVPASATTNGGTGTDGLIIRASGLDDATPIDFFIYPNITSVSTNSEQIGQNIIISGDHFGTVAESITINSQNTAVIGWNETSLTARIPGQEGITNINGKIQITRTDLKTSNDFPTDPSSFTILAPSVSGSAPASETTGQSSALIQFSGLGIDTDPGINPTLKLMKSGESDIDGAGYLTVIAYQTVEATFDLSGAAAGLWDLVIINMDGQQGLCSECFTVNPPSGPIVTGINPDFGLNTGIKNITSITGNNFQDGATAKLTKTAQTDITPSIVFTFTDPNALSNGAFDLSGQTLGWWNVVVTNPDLQTGSYGNEINTGFEIRSSVPLNPTNIYQFKNNSDTAEPPATETGIGNGIGGQLDVYFRMDMEGGLVGELYYPQIEIKPIGAVFDGTFTEGTGVLYNGTAVQGWVNITAEDGTSYHWRARTKNSSGISSWVSFGGNSDPNDIDLYIDNTPPIISPGTDGTCSTAVSNITDFNATILWDTSDITSGAQFPPSSGAYAFAQVQYIETNNFDNWIAEGTITTESSWENSPHQVAILSLSPGTDYTFRIKSKDFVRNESNSINCVFTTEGARPIKTVEFFILQETNNNTGTTIKKNFETTIPENNGISDSIQIVSAYIEISGVSSAAATQTINAGLLRGDQTAETGPAGNNYLLNSTGTTTPFTILFDALSPGGDNENISNITSGGVYAYTLFLNGDGITDVWLFSAKLIVTYNYKP